MPDPQQIDLSAGLTPKAPTTGGIDLSAGLTPVQNVNAPAPLSRESQVAGTQLALHGAASAVPGGELLVGAGKGLAETGKGIVSLLSGAAEKIGISPERIAAANKLAGVDTPEAEALTTPEGAAQKVGSAGEGVAEWMAGDAALEGVAKLAKIAKNAPHLIELMEQFPKTAKMVLAMGKGAVVGGAQGAAKEGSVEGGVKGAEGGAAGGAAGEVLSAVAKPILKSVGIGTESVEDAMRAAQPGKKNLKFMQDWSTAQPRLVKELEAGGKFTDMGDAADRIGDVRRKIWTDEVMPAIERHADEPFDTTNVAQAVRNKITPTLKKNFPEDAKFLQEFADKYTSGSPLFTGENTVADAEKEIELYNAKLESEGYWKKTPKERAALEKANPKIAAWRTASDEIRNSLYEHLDNNPLPGDPADIKALKNEYGAIGNVENEVRGQVNVGMRQRPVSLKQIIGMTAGIAHGGPLGLAAAALPIIDKLYNAPEELLNRAVSKSAPAGPVKQAVQAAAPTVKKVAKAAAGVAGENMVRFIASDGSTHEVPADQIDAAKKIDPNLRVQ